MIRLSSPLEDIQPHYEVVVIGSGYGGGIAASRFARAKRQVCVLERGKELQPGEYPDTGPEMAAETQIDLPDAHLGSRTGLYDVRVNDDINVFMGCGLGGTSLVNANVSLEAVREVWEDPVWPQGVRDDIDTRIEQGYRRARAMLKPQAYPGDDLKKLQALQDSAEGMGVGDRFYRPPINVTFEDGFNHVGVEQQECERCGDCMSGCNYSAKNTTLMNYLPDAFNHGAKIFCQVSVRRLERRDDGTWEVHFQPLEIGREAFQAPTMAITADIVVLGAGSLGSTEILLRSKAEGLSLSDQVGKRFTGNGDALGFAYNNDQPIDAVGFGHRDPAGREHVGPTITGIIDLRNKDKLEDEIVIEEGSLAGGVANLLPVGLSAAAAVFGKDTDAGDFFAEKRREWESVLRGPYHGATRNTQAFLVMAHDDGMGEMRLEDDRLRIHWPGVGSQPIFKTINETLHEATRPLGGTYVRNPTWSRLFGHDLVTVHPLGGCAMAERAEDGVVNHKGQVFSSPAGQQVYDNLYVTDGAVVPRTLGVNPLLTISALAERACAVAAADRGWNIDYEFGPVDPIPQAPPKQVGIRFTETMRGFFSDKVTEEDYQAAHDQGLRDGSSFQFILTILIDDLDGFLEDPEHAARMTGSVIAPALSEQPLIVTGGAFNLLFLDPQDDRDVRKMRYRMKLTAEDGSNFWFEGFKRVQDDPGDDMWYDTTTLFITLHEGADAGAPVLGRGILKIRNEDFQRQMTTLQVTNASSVQQRLEATGRFGAFFAGALFDIYGGVFARSTEMLDDVPPRKRRPLRMSAPEIHFFPADGDGARLRMIRYQGGEKGPVLITPGFGTSSKAYTMDTVETNLPEYLFASGYDIWLFDYRASPDLEAASTQFSLDDIATKDYPAAVRKVLEATGADDIQVMAHCVGSLTFLMSMMSGLEGVRSAVCSALGFYPITNTLNEFKAGIGLSSILTLLGVKTVTTDFDKDNWEDRLADDVLKFDRSFERCQSAVCRRIQTIYGPVYKHSQLNLATHQALHEVFGVANLKSLNHLAEMVRRRKIVNEKGKNVYLPHVDRLAIPLTLLHGAENQLFLPEGTMDTLRTLAKHNDAGLYSRIMLPNYAHMDMFVGQNADRDVFPFIAAELDRHNA
ncbi:MAG TPA: alpha/beta fold hydrolase [Acidobacteriota bacterium]|nr:alpha/beta fold hydrolase [Acidobacteriota bacterium]